MQHTNFKVMMNIFSGLHSRQIGLRFESGFWAARTRCQRRKLIEETTRIWEMPSDHHISTTSALVVPPLLKGRGCDTLFCFLFLRLFRLTCSIRSHSLEQEV